MPRKPVELPPEVAKAFVADMRAFHAEKSPIKRDEIASRQLVVLNEYLGRRHRPLRVIDVKEMFVQMRASVKFGVAPLARVLKLRNIGGTGSSPHEGVVGMRSRIHAVAVMAIFLISAPAWIAPAAAGSPRPLGNEAALTASPPTDVSAQRHYHYRYGYYRPTLPYDGYPPYPPPIYRCTYYGPFPLYPYCYGW
jgi:hypothetical protein